MPLCEGRSNGPGHHEPCPDKRADASVRNRQGDLMLCDSCSDYRFPDSKRTRSTKLRATNSSAPIKSTSSKVTPTAPSTSAGRSCASLTCDLCSGIFNQESSTLPKEVFDTMISIVEFTGWVCYECRKTCRVKIDKVLSSQSKTIEEVATLANSVDKLARDVQDLDTKFLLAPRSDTVPVQLSSATTQSEQVIKSCVVKTVQDISRRERNVIVSGLHPVPNCTDEQVFTALCEDNLSVKPAIVRCRRIGRKGDGSRPRPQLLLVELRTAQVATELRRAGRLLKLSTDADIRSVYINPDLTPEQAKLAYEKRQKRRNRLHEVAQASTSGPVPSAAPSARPSSSGSTSSVDDQNTATICTADFLST